MKAKELIDCLTFPIKEKVSELLKRPYAGSRVFDCIHPDARYASNCHGTMAYVFGLKDPIVEKRAHPGIVRDFQMEKLIEKYFMRSDHFEVGDLVAFYKSLNEDKLLLHTALLISSGGRIFQQSGTGGVFEPALIFEKQKRLEVVLSTGVEVTSYKLN